MLGNCCPDGPGTGCCCPDGPGIGCCCKLSVINLLLLVGGGDDGGDRCRTGDDRNADDDCSVIGCGELGGEGVYADSDDASDPGDGGGDADGDDCGIGGCCCGGGGNGATSATTGGGC